MAAGTDVEDEAERNRAAPLEEEEPSSGNSTPRSSSDEGGGACTGDAAAPAGLPPEAISNERGGGCVEERRAHDERALEGATEEGEIKTACNRELGDASKPAGDRGASGEGERTPPGCDAQVVDLRLQLQQVAEQLADLEVWSSHDDDDSDAEKVVAIAEEEAHREEDPEFLKEPVFKEEEEEDDEDEDEDDDSDDDGDQFGDAAEVFKEDFSSKIPVYDEYPHDLPQIPSVRCDFSAEGSAMTSHLSFGREGIDDDQIQQVLYQKFVKVRRSKPNGSGGKKRRTHYQMHQKQIRKRRKRRAYEPVR